MNTERSHWQPNVVLATLIACVSSSVPFLMLGTGSQIAKLSATILFVSSIIAYVTAMKLSGVRFLAGQGGRGPTSSGGVLAARPAKKIPTPMEAVCHRSASTERRPDRAPRPVVR